MSETEPHLAGGEHAPDAACSFYLRHRHGLIQRHTECIALNPDHSARWQLRVDLALPDHEDAYLPIQGSNDEKRAFLFPLAFLKKIDPRTGFEVRDESGALIPIPLRAECDDISGLGAAHASESIAATLDSPPKIPAPELRTMIARMAAANPFHASLMLRRVRLRLGLEQDRQTSAGLAELGRAWDENGLLEVLHMLVDHSMVWVPLEGRPGERRSIVISQEITMVRRVFVRWIFGELRIPRRWYIHPFRVWRALAPQASFLKLAGRRYGRRTYRTSFSALGERIGQPFGWAPYEYEFPTVYTKRCRSYHLEVTCPPGRSPRDVRPATGMPLAEPSHYRKGDESVGRTVLTSRFARHDREGSRNHVDIWFRVTVGVGDGAFPVLWFLTGAITALMLWLVAGYASEVKEKDPQVMAAILLIVPALVAGLAISDNTVPVTRLISGARILLLLTGLSAVMASAVLIGAEPFGISAVWSWTGCAMVATASTIPLATGWLLSSELLWHQLKRLKSRQRQKAALSFGVFLGLIAVASLIAVVDDPVSRGLIGGYLLVLAVGLTVVANNRAAMPIDEARRYISFSLLLAAITCLALGCIELQAAIGEYKGLQEWAERAALLTLVISLSAGSVVSRLTSRFAPAEAEIHVSPRVGRAMLAGEAVRELAILREREEEVSRKDAAG